MHSGITRTYFIIFMLGKLEAYEGATKEGRGT